MNASRHLTEAERHDVADNLAMAEPLFRAPEHLDHCASCAADVARIKGLMARFRETARPTDTGPDLWPEIQSRIERGKLLQLPSGLAQPAKTQLHSWRIVVGLAAAALLIVALPTLRRRSIDVPSVSATPEAVGVSFVADSARAYEQEATVLLNELEMRRAMMNPQTRALVDHDIAVIDKAIAELRDAIARDPNNAALRRLLASSYRQKVELLKRAGSSG